MGLDSSPGEIDSFFESFPHSWKVLAVGLLWDKWWLGICERMMLSVMLELVLDHLLDMPLTAAIMMGNGEIECSDDRHRVVGGY